VSRKSTMRGDETLEAGRLRKPEDGWKAWSRLDVASEKQSRDLRA